MISPVALSPHGESVSVLGVKTTPFESVEHAARYARNRIATGRKTFCVAVNPEKVERARQDPALKRVIEEADIRLCDGIGIALASLILNKLRLARCTGVDLFFELVRTAAIENWSVFLLGASEESNEGAQQQLLRLFPGLSISGRQSGYFENSAELVEKVNASGAHMLFVAMGSPRQELWIAEYRNRLKPLFIMGVGGSFDVLSGGTRRAPILFRKTGTEWLYRLMTEPRRMRRQLVLPAFVFHVLAQFFGLHVTPLGRSRKTS